LYVLVIALLMSAILLGLAATPPSVVGPRFAETLARKGIENGEGREGAYRFLTTGEPSLFRELGERFLQLPLGEIEQVAVADLEAVA